MGSYEQGLKALDQRRAAALQMGGPDRVERQHRKGKLTCRERLDLLLDPGSFVELGMLAATKIEAPGKETVRAAAAGVVVGYGTAGGRPVYVAADDATIAGGSRGMFGPNKTGWVEHLARRHKVPIVLLEEASAVRVQDRAGSTKFLSMPFVPGRSMQSGQIEMSGVVPLVCAIMGNRPAAFTAARSDFVPMVRNSTFMAIAGPPVVHAATRERLRSYQELGGAEMHAHYTGQVDYVAEDDADCIRVIKEYLGYMPSSCYELPPRVKTDDDPRRRVDELKQIVPENLRKPYDMYEVIRVLVDEGKYLPIKKDYGRTIITCLARINGHPVGIIANQPNYLGGATDAAGAYKYAHFADICSAFHIPIVTLADTPGMIIGSKFEREGSLKALIRVFNARHRMLDLPNVTIILRKAYGMGYWIMGGRANGPDFIYSWPIGSISQMPPEALVEVIYKTQLEQAADREVLKRQYLELFSQDYAPWGGAEVFGVDDIIDPGETRWIIARSLEMAVRGLSSGFRHDIYP